MANFRELLPLDSQTIANEHPWTSEVADFVNGGTVLPSNPSLIAPKIDGTAPIIEEIGAGNSVVRRVSYEAPPTPTQTTGITIFERLGN